MLDARSSLFGSRNRTAILIAIRLLEETYVSELAALLGLRLYTVQTVVAALERDAVLVGRTFGRTRRIALNGRYVAHAELGSLLWKLGQHDIDLQKMLATRRRRPRRPGKPGL